MEWDPTQFLREDENIQPHPFALVVLNQPINEVALEVLTKHAQLTVCADGGANRFYEYAKSHGEESTDLPTTIIGDLDSINPEIRAHYENLDVEIIQDEDQYSTDFTKSLRFIQKSRGDGLSILVLGGLGGRVDQAFSQIHHLCMVSEERKKSQSKTQGNDDGKAKGNLYLISEESITFILHPGKNTIRTPRTNRPPPPDTTSPSPETEQPHLLEENVGIIPLSGPASITTTGFQWDVSNWETQIGGQISTSNHIRADVVTVESKVPVLFTVELAGRLKRM
ncbi:thiamine diphosphokinase, partial [Aspergillus stella-maris]|uniref:thiamine diphosphokinase n=1 Tax=Aspergillus stella-maris TaxID=1810926 RepID=UPI003CCDB019